MEDDPRYWQDRAHTAEQELELTLDSLRRMRFELDYWRELNRETRGRLWDHYHRLCRPELGGPVMFRHAEAEAIRRILE